LTFHISIGGRLRHLSADAVKKIEILHAAATRENDKAAFAAQRQNEKREFESGENFY
jgi:hypothetical protein